MIDISLSNISDIVSVSNSWGFAAFTKVLAWLFISKNIIEAHGGKIWAENNDNDAYGQNGATFYFMLPLTDQQQQQLNANWLVYDVNQEDHNAVNNITY